MRVQVLKVVRAEILEHLKHFIIGGNNLFSVVKIAELPVLKAVFEEVEYKISIEWV